MDRKQVIIAFLAYFLMTSVYNIYFLFGPVYETMGGTATEIGLFFSAFYMMMLICSPLGSSVMERFNIKLSMIGSGVLCTLSTILLVLFIDSPVAMIISRVIMGVAASIYIVAVLAAQSLIFDEESRGLGFALFTTGSMLPLATFLPLCEWFIRKGSIAAFLWTPVVLAALCVILGIVIKNVDYKKSGSEEDEEWGRYRDLFAHGAFIVLITTAFIMGTADAMTISIAALSAEKLVPASFFMVAEAISSVGIRTLGYRLISRFPRTLLAAVSAGIMGASLLALSFSSSPIAFAVFGFTFGIGIGIGFPTHLSLVGDIIPRKFYPKATGMVVLMINVGWTLTPMIYSSLCTPLGVSGTFRAVGALVLAIAVLLEIKFWIPITNRRR
ncbi:MAG: MFS transporter [Synergistes sp.]|nr:MFS transporter [Synergistes sp.]